MGARCLLHLLGRVRRPGGRRRRCRRSSFSSPALALPAPFGVLNLSGLRLGSSRPPGRRFPFLIALPLFVLVFVSSRVRACFVRVRFLAFVSFSPISFPVFVATLPDRRLLVVFRGASCSFVLALGGSGGAQLRPPPRRCRVSLRRLPPGEGSFPSLPWRLFAWNRLRLALAVSRVRLSARPGSLRAWILCLPVALPMSSPAWIASVCASGPLLRRRPTSMPGSPPTASSGLVGPSSRLTGSLFVPSSRSGGPSERLGGRPGPSALYPLGPPCLVVFASPLGRPWAFLAPSSS